jgi:AraC-like DNA-binding protein
VLASCDLAHIPSVTLESLLGSGPQRFPGPVRFSLGDAARRDGPMLWEACLARMGFAHRVHPLPDEEFELDIAINAMPGIVMAAGKLCGAQRQRTRALVENGADEIGLVVSLKGRFFLAQRGEELELHEGEAAFLSCSDPYRSTQEAAGHVLALRFPRARFAPLVNGLGDHCMRRIRDDTPALRFLTDYAEQAWERQTTTCRDLQNVVVNHFYDLIAIVFGATRDAEQLAQGRGLRAARLKAIKDDIAEHLARCDLSLTALAVRHGLAPRLVQRLFEAEGTSFTEYVLTQRLARAHRLLGDPRRRDEKISAIAWDSGFGDLSYFNQAFRKRYGLTPSDVRAQATHH